MSGRLFCKSRTGPRAFTLVELLVASAVVALVLGILLQISGGAMLVTQSTHRKLEAAAAARTALDALGADLANAITQHGMTVFARAETPNSLLGFLTRSRTSEAGSRCLAVNYSLSAEGALDRRTLPAQWSDAALVVKTAGAASVPEASAVAEGILRFEVVAELEDGSRVPLTPNGVWNDTVVNAQSVTGGYFGLNFEDAAAGRLRVRALTVGVVAVDGKGFRLLESLGKTEELRGKFSSPAGNQTPAEVWEPRLTDGALNDIPAVVSGALQVMQKTYPLR